GANHADKGIPCQDAAMSATLYHRGYLFYFMAVADGHGGESYTQSDAGSFLALQAAGESVNRFIMFVIDVYEKYPQAWVDMVKDDFSGRFGRTLVSNWTRMVLAHANDTEYNEDEVVKRYGTTITAALVFKDQLFSGRIGDSPAYILGKDKKPEVRALFEEEDRQNNSLGLATASLCSRDAYRHWQAKTLPLDRAAMVALATDGFADSLKDPPAYIAELYRRSGKRDAAGMERLITGELEGITEKGVGDDISLLLFLIGE
ncbi:MAG: protein phosphatase 2C domain-containing protein, partial [Treponema sp.]|nr:protein phosphatase 2C domain-containing protein [Treponema sp.]